MYQVNDNEHVNGSLQNSLLIAEMVVNEQFHKRANQIGDQNDQIQNNFPNS